MSQLILTTIFIVIWIPSLLFTSSNISLSPPLRETATLKGPYQWTYEKRDIYMHEQRPEFLLYGHIKTKSEPYRVVVRSNFMEWLFSTKRFRSNSRVLHTGLEAKPFVTEWGLEHDEGLSFRIVDLRFNWIFIAALFFSLALPVLYILMLLADNFVIDTPEQRKRKSENYINLVKEIELRANNNPRWLKRKTISLAFLGYIVVIGSILLMIPVGIGLFASLIMLTGGNAGGAKLGLILALVPIGFAWHMGKSLLAMGFEFEGVEVTRKDCPALFDFLGKICKKVKGPKFKRVFIDYNLNASVSRSGGLFGFFGMGPVVLTLGLPLMQSMTDKQLAGVIGHEYGHVAAKDNALGQWVYRIRNSWLLLGERLSLDTLWYALKLNRFYSWFIATFSAYSFALSRRCEYEADAFSARLVGKDAMADSLSALVVFGNQYDEQFWKNIWQDSDNGRDISSVKPYSNVPNFFASLGDVSETVSVALKQKTNFTATHPAISDRLAALSAKFKEPQEPGAKASSRLLGNLEAKLISQFDREWRDSAHENWQARQDDQKYWLEKYDKFRQKPIQDLTDEQLGEFISACSQLHNNELYFAANTEMLRRYPESTDASLNCIWYRLIIQKDDEQLAMMEALAKTNPEHIPNICRYAIEFLTSAGREDETAPYYERLENWEYVRSAAEEEREIVMATDKYKSHGFAPETIENFVQYFTGHPIISEVYMAQKEVNYMPEYPCYVIAYKTKAHFWVSKKSIEKQVGTFVQNSGLTAEYLFIELNSVQGLKSKMKKIKGSKIY